MTFDMQGRIDECFLISYAVDAARAESLVPPQLEVLTHGGRAFLNIVVCHVHRMRPALAPSFLGISYWHVAYRLHVRAPLADGRSIDGLYFLRSDADSAVVGAIANRMTAFRFHPADVRFESARGGWTMRVVDRRGQGSAMLRVVPASSDIPEIAEDPPFPSIQDRERVLKYAPFGLSVSRTGTRVRIAEVKRHEALWKEEPVSVEAADWSYAEALGLSTDRLVRATRVAPIDYIWRIGLSGERAKRSGARERRGASGSPRVSV
ncbi:MAG TPA: DUF2071 domain-containing protein [Vicinamibacterales bacterium]